MASSPGTRTRKRIGALIKNILGTVLWIMAFVTTFVDLGLPADSRDLIVLALLVLNVRLDSASSAKEIVQNPDDLERRLLNKEEAKGPKEGP